MSYLPSINKKIIVILLLLQVSIAYAIPAWASINLCIGYDGHVDIETRGIDDRVAEPFSQLTVVSSNDGHHGDCFDFEISGLATEHLYLRAEELRFRDGESATQIYRVGALSSYIDLSQLSPSPTLFPYNGTTLPSDFTIHWTVVLLI